MGHFVKPFFLGAVAISPQLHLLAHWLSSRMPISGIWRGTTTYQGYNDYPLNNDPSDMHGTIDWVVFCAGDFTPGYISWVPTPGEFVYAYQVIQDGDASDPLLALSVVLDAQADDIGTFFGNGVVGSSSTSEFFVGGPFPSANWSFDPAIEAGVTSLGLAFSSPFGPILLSGSVAGVGGSSQGDVSSLPSPIPEPSSIVLGILAGVGLATVAIRKRTTFSLKAITSQKRPFHSSGHFAALAVTPRNACTR